MALSGSLVQIGRVRLQVGAGTATPGMFWRIQTRVVSEVKNSVSYSRSENMTGSYPRKVAIIGLRHDHVGSIGPEKQGLIQVFRRLEEVEIAAYCEDTNTGLLNAAYEHGSDASVYISVDDLIADEDFDIASITLLPNEIPEVGIKLAEAGKHFFTEKQFARRKEFFSSLLALAPISPAGRESRPASRVAPTRGSQPSFATRPQPTLFSALLPTARALSPRACA